jgi:hypothetical protein
MKTLAVVIMFGQIGLEQEPQKDGWQFESFFGTYSVVQSAESCSTASDVWIGYRYTEKFPQIEINFQQDYKKKIFESLIAGYSTGEECYECDPDWWESRVTGGGWFEYCEFFQTGYRSLQS